MKRARYKLSQNQSSSRFLVARPKLVSGGDVGPWNSLEVTKLIVALVTPVTIGLAATYINYSNNARQIEVNNNNRATDKLVEFWIEVSKPSDDIVRASMGGEDPDPKNLDLIEEDCQLISRSLVTYSPFIPTRVERAASSLIDAALVYTERPNDKTMWDVLTASDDLKRAVRTSLVAGGADSTPQLRANAPRKRPTENSGTLLLPR